MSPAAKSQKSYTEFSLEALRKRLGYSQLEMANRMGMGARAYFTIEQDPETMNIRHVMLAQMASLKVAVERADKSLADEQVAELASMYCRIGRMKRRVI